MPEARDRLSRHDDVLATYSNRRRRNFRNGGRGNSVIFVLGDESDERQATGTPIRWRGASMVTRPGPMRGLAAGGSGRGTNIRTSRFGVYRSPAPVVGRENLSPVLGSVRGRGRGSGSSVLPIWYPRTPLRDITAVVRAVESRRSRFGEGEGLLLESPILHDWRTVRDPSLSSSGAPLEHRISMISPHPTAGIKRCPPSIGKVPKILLDITKQNDGDSGCLTPQKKLLNNIDAVEKVVMKELHKLKRTPSAKRAEREKRVRTLMSMR